MKPLTPSLLLGIDAGTSVVKVALFDVHGNELAVVRRPTLLVSPQPLWSETDMAATWEVVAACVRALLQQSGVNAGSIGAVGLTGTMVGAWLVDAAGLPVRNGILWNDGRTQPLIERMSAANTDFMRAIFRASGSIMQQGCTLPLLAWLKQNEPEALARAAAVLCCKDWIGFKLTGVVGLDPSEATVLPGDVHARTYSEEMIDLFGLRDQRALFPEVRPSERILGTVTAAAAAQTGLRAGTPVGVGAGDVIASTLGLGAFAASDACTLLGTNILNCLVLAAPDMAPMDIGVMFTLPAGRWLRAMINVSGTTSLDWFIAHFCEAERRAAQADGALFARLEALAGQSSAGANGVLYLPYLSELGITAPYYEPTARAQFCGLTDRHTRADMLRAVYEGVALSIRDGYAALPKPALAIRLSGGGARSAFWSQMIADACGVPVIVPKGATEYGAKGAALLAAVGIGIYAAVEDALAAAQGDVLRFEPQAEMVDLYTRRYAVYKALREDLRRAWHIAAGA